MNSIRAIAEVTGAGRQQTSQAQNEDVFLDNKALLERLPISAKTAYNWRESGVLPYIKVPGSKRVVYHWGSVVAALHRAQRGLAA